MGSTSDWMSCSFKDISEMILSGFLSENITLEDFDFFSPYDFKYCFFFFNPRHSKVCLPFPFSVGL